MLKSILVGLDGSSSSNIAVDLGIQWAQRFNALLVGLGIVDEVTIRTPVAEPFAGGYYPPELDDVQVERERRAVADRLTLFGSRCAAAGISFDLLEETGFPYDTILRESKRCDLVLFGHETHFRFGTAGRPNETLWKVLKQGSRPVVVAPEELTGGVSTVLAYNGSPQADRALQAFQSSGLDMDEEVCVLVSDEIAEEAARQADRTAEFLHLHRINATTQTEGPVDSIAQMILTEVRRRTARLLVMGAYGHSSMREHLLGSVTADVLKESPVPVFMCH
jgi:nucleotide-binding universal stress UspA family protein